MKALAASYQDGVSRGSAAVADLSIVVLCYRAEDFVPVFVSQIRAALDERKLRYELVLVANYDGDGRTADRTPAIATELMRQYPAIKAVTRPKEGMMGWDMRTGLEAATGDAIVVIDGDGQMAARDILAVYDVLQQGGCDMVMTYRRQRHDGLLRTVISCVYNGLLRLMFPAVHVRDANSKPKIITRRALEQLSLRSSGWFVDAEMVLQATYRGLRIAEVPTVFYCNERRRSFVRPRAIAEFIGEMLRHRLRNLRGDKGRPPSS